MNSEGKGGVQKMLSHTPEDRGSQPGQRGEDRDHPRFDNRVQTPGVGQQSERFPMESPAIRSRGLGQGYPNMGDRGQYCTGGQQVSPMNANNNNMTGSFVQTQYLQFYIRQDHQQLRTSMLFRA